MPLPWTPEQIGLAALAFVASTVITTGIVAAYLVLIPPNHFIADERGLASKIRSPVLQVLWRVVKNIIGLALVVIGVLLSLPGVPGQGLLTIFVGILMLDVPGKRGLELRIVRRPAICRTIDSIRARFERPPLVLDALEPESESPGSVSDEV
ncbi:MAG TPA: hypothetical protein ENK57_14945 [Polyangiaceae bacterium]|nr:hypothetical protein [Polyangiaceae bacterium]